MMNSPEILDRSVIRSSVRPSAKYSSSGSLLRLSNGRTAMEGRSGSGGAGLFLFGRSGSARQIEVPGSAGGHDHEQADCAAIASRVRQGREMPRRTVARSERNR